MLESPVTRLRKLRQRISGGEDLSIAQIAQEFGVSDDTVRRDLVALEEEGVVRRVRGGAIPVIAPTGPLTERLDDPAPEIERIAIAALPLVGDEATLLLDGGRSVQALAARLDPSPARLVITPSPWIATVTMSRGIETFLIGGQISARGGIAIGPETEAALAGVSGGVAVLGACGIEAEFGLGADDAAEAAVKRCMARSAARVLILAGAGKLGKRARHRTLACAEIDALVTDGGDEDVAPLRQAGIEIHHA